jgi:hypothetical protein
MMFGRDINLLRSGNVIDVEQRLSGSIPRSKLLRCELIGGRVSGGRICHMPHSADPLCEESNWSLHFLPLEIKTGNYSY